MPIQPALFETHAIRRLYDEETETWWFSVVDIMQVLTQQPDYQTASKDWNKLKEQLGKEGGQSVTDCHQLKMLDADGKQRETDAATAETLLRLVQSVPSPKAEPIKLWLTMQTSLSNPESNAPKTGRGSKATSACPQCGKHRLVPISRRGIDHFLGLFVSLRRFRCNNIECGWQGNLAKSQVVRRSVKHLPQFKERLNLLMLISNTIMLLVILLIVVALFIGWIDGSLEGWEGLFNRQG